MFRYLVPLLFILGTSVVFYFSWLPNPDIGVNSYFPKWLTEWTSKNGNLRTAVPFLFLGALLELHYVRPYSRWKIRSRILLILLGIVILAEIGQLLLPMRHFDVQDIGWGVVGSVFGIYIGSICKLMVGK